MRRLAQGSGVSHSTIPRLFIGSRSTALETAMKLARRLGYDGEAPPQLGMDPGIANHPTARVEHADGLLSASEMQEG